MPQNVKNEMAKKSTTRIRFLPLSLLSLVREFLLFTAVENRNRSTADVTKPIFCLCLVQFIPERQSLSDSSVPFSSKRAITAVSCLVFA